MLDDDSIRVLFCELEPMGAWLGAVCPPMRLGILHVGDDLLAGVYRDEAGVEYIGVFQLEWTGW